MCGNFGLLRIQEPLIKKRSSIAELLSRSRGKEIDHLDGSFHDQVEAVSRTGGVIIADTSPDSAHGAQPSSKKIGFVQLFTDLAALTEFRGGQAGGISTFEYTDKELMTKPSVARMRCVGRKRYTLAEDMANRYTSLTTALGSDFSTFTAIGHTRFATSSANVETELHPHEW